MNNSTTIAFEHDHYWVYKENNMAIGIMVPARTNNIVLDCRAVFTAKRMVANAHRHSGGLPTDNENNVSIISWS